MEGRKEEDDADDEVRIRIRKWEGRTGKNDNDDDNDEDEEDDDDGGEEEENGRKIISATCKRD